MYGKGWDADVLKKYDAQKVGKGEYAEVSIGSLSTTAQTQQITPAGAVNETYAESQNRYIENFRQQMSQAQTQKFDSCSQIWKGQSQNLSGMPTTASISGDAKVTQDASQASLGLTPSERRVRVHNQMPTRFDERVLERQYGISMEDYQENPIKQFLTPYELFSEHKIP